MHLMKRHRESLPKTSRQESLCGHEHNLHFSFAGGAILSFFNVGITRYILKKYDRNDVSRVYGISGGALCGLWFLATHDSKNFDLVTDTYVKEWEAKVAREGGKVALQRSLRYHRSLLWRFLPNDAYIRCSGKLHIALTRARTGKLETISEFHSQKHLIDTVIAAMSIPFVNTWRPVRVDKKWYLDAGMITNQITCCSEVICCSPFPQLFSFWKKPEFVPHQSIMGRNRLIDAFDPETDVRKQLEMGFEAAKTFFEEPYQQPRLSSGQPRGIFPTLQALGAS